jgi:glucose dehydrogenase
MERDTKIYAAWFILLWWKASLIACLVSAVGLFIIFGCTGLIALGGALYSRVIMQGKLMMVMIIEIMTI